MIISVGFVRTFLSSFEVPFLNASVTIPIFVFPAVSTVALMSGRAIIIRIITIRRRIPIRHTFFCSWASIHAGHIVEPITLTLVHARTSNALFRSWASIHAGHVVEPITLTLVHARTSNALFRSWASIHAGHIVVSITLTLVHA